MTEPASKREIHPLAWFWIYTALRLGLYLVVFGLLWLFGLGGFVGAAVALVLTIPLSFVILARPRAAMVASLDVVRSQRRARADAFDEQLRDPPPTRSEAGVASPAELDEPRRKKKNRS